MASESEFSDASDIDELCDDDAPPLIRIAEAKPASKGKGKGKVTSEDVDFMRGALKASRNTTYSTEALYSASLPLGPIRC
jgi:hypothetical protein